MNAAAAAPIEQHPRPFELHYQDPSEAACSRVCKPKPSTRTRAVRRVGARFDHQIDALTVSQLSDYFSELHSRIRASVKLEWPSPAGRPTFIFVERSDLRSVAARAYGLAAISVRGFHL